MESRGWIKPVSKKDVRIALDYVLGRKSRTELNKAYGLKDYSPSGMHRVGRSMRHLATKHKEFAALLSGLSPKYGGKAVSYAQAGCLCDDD